MKVFFDTNVLVSAVATRGLCADLLRVVLAQHELLVGEVVLRELRRVLRQKFRLPGALVEETEAFLRDQATVIAKAPPASVAIRDPADAFVLGEAIAGGADLLVTGDHDLLAVAEASPIAIVTPRGLWERFRVASGS